MPSVKARTNVPMPTSLEEGSEGGGEEAAMINTAVGCKGWCGGMGGTKFLRKIKNCRVCVGRVLLLRLLLLLSLHLLHPLRLFV